LTLAPGVPVLIATLLAPHPLADTPGRTIQVSAESRSLEPGELVVLTMTLPEPRARVRVRAFGRDVPAFAIGVRAWRALVGIDLDVTPRTYTATIDADDLQATCDLVVKARVFPMRHLRVDEAFVNPPAAVQERIEREAKTLEAIWNAPPSERLWSGRFIRPVPQPANSRFGTRSVFNGVPRSAHGGADFLSPSGTPVHAPNGGRVVLARDLYFSGNTVIIDHGVGLFSTLAHLSAIDVREGDTVRPGQIVGRVGATGRVTGPHLHWAVRASFARVDPLAVLALLGKRGP
jgi:murein DD-endopeptidase MepM/ murein hydrolase activator NlpD